MLQALELSQATRLINHGPVVMVSAKAGGEENVMSAAWVCALDYAPARVTVVLDKGAFTRGLVEQSGWFALQVPLVAQAETVLRWAARAAKIIRPSWLTAAWNCFIKQASMCRW